MPRKPHLLKRVLLSFAAVTVLALTMLALPTLQRPLQAQEGWTGWLPLVLRPEPAASGQSLFSEGPSPTSFLMAPGDPAAIAGLENCFSVAYDFLRGGTDSDLILLFVTCEESNGLFGNRAYLAQVPHTGGLAAATLLPVPLADTMAGGNQEDARIATSVKAEPTADGWSILTVLINKLPENHSTLFLSSITTAQVDAYLNDGTPFIFDFGLESNRIDSGTLILMGHRPETKLSVFQEEYYYALIACGKDIEQGLDHSSCYHSMLIPKASPLALETHVLILSRNADGTMNLLPEPWGAGDDIRETIDAANWDADFPDPPEYEVPFKGTQVPSSGRTNVWQGGGTCVPLEQPVCIVFDSKGPPRWHKDLKEIPEDVGYLAYAVAGPGWTAVNAGEVYPGLDYGTVTGLTDFTGGFTAIPYPIPVKDESGTITGYGIEMWSSTDYIIHASPVGLAIGY